MRGVGGATGIQCIGYYQEQDRIERHMVGYLYAFEEHAVNALDMELSGLETALKLTVSTT